MTFIKTPILTAALVGLSFSASQAQSPMFTTGDATATSGTALEFVLKVDATYRQNPLSVDFTGGQHRIFLRDGQVAYDAPCSGKVYIAPNSVLYENYFGQIIISPPCAGGTSGFLSGGDINADGVSDPAAYLAVTQVTAAQLVEPSRADKIQLISAPPSLLPRPSAGFDSTSALLFYNIQTSRILQYKMSQYFFNRVYTAAERGTFDDSIVQGTYRYIFPLVGNPPVPVPIDVTYFGGVDGSRKVNNQKRGFRFNGFTFIGGFAQLDPSKPNTITWEGNTADKVSATTDTTQLRIIPLADPADPLSDANPGAGTIFPQFAAPGVTQVTLVNPLETEYTLPPGIIPVGTTGLLQVTLVRNRGGFVADKSTTVFSIPVQFNPPGSPDIVAASFIAGKLPSTATEAQKAFDFDFDGDGVSNFTEWVFKSDPGKAGSTPIAPQLAFEPASASSDDGAISAKNETTSGNWVFKVDKIEGAEPALDYCIERSSDMNAWSKVLDTDPNWQLIESASEIKVVSRSSELSGGSFFRVCVKEKP